MDKIKRDRSKSLYRKRKEAWDLTPKDNSTQLKLLVLCVVVAVVGIALWMMPAIKPKDPVVDQTPTLPDHSVQTPNSSTIQQSDPVGKSYFSDTLFVGDSIVLQLKDLEIFERAKFAASANLNPENALGFSVNEAGTVADNVKTHRPKKVYIALGCNGASWMTPDQMAADIGALVQKIKEQNQNTKIVVLSSPGYSSQAIGQCPNCDNDAVAAFNTALKAAALEWDVSFLDSGSGVVADIVGGKPACDEANLKALERYLTTHTLG